MVKITFKTVQNKLFTVDAEETETVVDLKKKIQEAQTFPVENQKLIYSGKILQDSATVASLKIKEKDFLVVMVSKPKAAPAAAPTPVAPAIAAEATPAAPVPTAEASTSTPAPIASTQSATAPVPSAETAAPSEAQAFGSGGSFVTGSALQQAIASMVEMGFDKELAQKAMRASFNNPDRAVEYLMSGNIPDIGGDAGGSAPAAAPARQPAPAAAPAPQAAAPAAPAIAPAAPTGQAGSAENLFAAAEAAMNRDRGGGAGAGAGALGAGAGGGAGGAGAMGGLDPAALEALMNNPQMAAIRQAVQQNPAMIQPLLQHLAQANPALAQLIAQNPEMLYELLGAGAGEGDDDEDYGMGGMGEQVQVTLTPDEGAAVERLEALGFPRQQVLQAFLLCDKNEELAANFLFDQGEDD